MPKARCGCFVRRKVMGAGIASSIVSCGRPVVTRPVVVDGVTLDLCYCELHTRLFEKKARARAARKQAK